MSQITMEHLVEIQQAVANQHGQKVDLYHDEAIRQIMITQHNNPNNLLQVIKY